MSYPEFLKHTFKTGVQGAKPLAGARGVPAKILFTSSARCLRRRAEEREVTKEHFYGYQTIL
jgi:hypothetical protein